MKMIVAVVRDEFAGPLTEQLAQKGFGATKLASTGGFLKAGNTTFLIGLAQEQLEEALGVIRSVCAYSPDGADVAAPDLSVPGVSTVAGQPVPPAVRVGGATVFVLSVAKMLKV